MSKEIYFSKIRDVKTPSRGTPNSAGIDFYIPNYSLEFQGDLLIKANNSSNAIINSTNIELLPHKDILIPAGIKYRGIPGTALIAFNKSGVATKNKLVCGACVIDEDYEGEIHLHLINTSDSQITLEYGQKILQFILLPTFYSTIKIIEVENLFCNFSERKEGAFGSTSIT